MKKITALASLLLFISCQNRDNNSATKLVKTISPDEWLKYDFKDHIKRQSDSTGDNDQAAILYSNSGNYFSALEVFDHSYDPVAYQPVFIDSSNFKAVPAIDYILEEARKSQVIIINEAHHVSYHRYFTMLLLKKLHDQGFTYFGAETLNVMDSALNKRGYPIVHSGFYTSEPQYGNLIRQAIQSGYRVFAYEANDGSNGKPREIAQARNIEKILKKDPRAKIIIHCGYSHLLEGPVQDWGKAMAGRLTEFTGIDPLTIDQVELTEHFDRKYENPYYLKMNYTTFVVLKNSETVIPPSFRMDGSQSDIFVYHPRTHLKFNRPRWLFDFYMPTFIHNSITLAFPVLVKAYISSENEKEAIPVDVIEIGGLKDSTALALLPGKHYKIVIENRHQERQTLELDL